MMKNFSHTLLFVDPLDLCKTKDELDGLIDALDEVQMDLEFMAMETTACTCGRC
jgi:hypothetical protein